MNALWLAEAKSNLALFGVIDLPSRNIAALAPQGVLAPRAFFLHTQDVNLTVPDAAGHVGIIGIDRQQPAGDAFGQRQQVLRAADELAHRHLVLIS